jgi:hypothetical protein
MRVPVIPEVIFPFGDSFLRNNDGWNPVGLSGRRP